MSGIDAFSLTAHEWHSYLSTSLPYLPELDSALVDVATFVTKTQVGYTLEQTNALMPWASQIPTTPYTAYRRFMADGDRTQYETPYFGKRKNLAAAALRLAFGHKELKALVQDYIWAICEETTWVLPAHEERCIDLFSAETGLLLAETVNLLSDEIDAEVRHRVYVEVDNRIFSLYFRFHHALGWYMGSNNWNGVCNSSVAATFLWLEHDHHRTAQALELALAGLKVFLDTAFESDGGSTEGVSYWHYGLMNLVLLSEMLYARTSGAINLLDTEQLRKIAAYPAKMQLSGSAFASFSDCHETSRFNPGIITRMALRTGDQSLIGLLAHPAELESDWRLSMMLRNMLWWDGTQTESAAITDAYLPAAGTVRMVASTTAGVPVVIIVKGGHNAENHNQNDVGSFIVHASGDNLLTDPGPGLYTRQYFSSERYSNVFANSYGHSVPRIGGQLQSAGRKFNGEVLSVAPSGSTKRVQIAFGRAYPIAGLESAIRTLAVAEDGMIWLEDEFRFTEAPADVEEAFVTWHDVMLNDEGAIIHGTAHDLRMVIEAPVGARFDVESLEDESNANAKPHVLKRLRVVIPAASQLGFRMRLEVM